MDLDELRTQINEVGTVLIAPGDSPLDPAQWDRLDALTAPNALPYETVEFGDSGDVHRVDVGRFLTDSDEPRAVHPAADDMMTIINGPAMRHLYEDLLGLTALTIRRCQVNLLRQGGFVGVHVDQDANPDYLAAVVLQLGNDYQGGEYVVLHERCGRLCYRIAHRSVLISRCDLCHEVTAVTSGVRKTLVYFIGAHAGKNRRWLMDHPGA